jgi:hypothetical protein
MSMGADTFLVNGQLLPFPTPAAYGPQGYGPQTMGVPNVAAAYPPYKGAGGAMTQAPGSESIGGYGTAGNNNIVASIGAAHPWNPRVSPVPWALAGLIGSLLVLKAVHWRETILEGREGIDIGPAHEHAEAGA